MPPNHRDPYSLSTTTPWRVDKASQVLGKRKLSDVNDSFGCGESGKYSSNSVESSLYQLERYTSKSLNTEHSSRWYSSMLLQDAHQFLVPRLDRIHWKKLSTRAKEIIGVCLQDILNRQCDGWKFLGLTGDLPFFAHPNLPWQFTLILGGTFRVGMSPDLQDQLHRCLLDYFHVSTTEELPMSSYQVQHALQLSQRGTGVNDSFCEVAPFLLATVPIPCEQAKSLLSYNQENVRGMGVPAPFRLPTETEWEYAARGGGWDILFPYDCRISVSRTDDLGPRNAMGLRQVGTFPELCMATCSKWGSVCPAGDLVEMGGPEMWSLIYYSRPAKQRCGLDDMEDATYGSHKVVRLAMDIFSKHTFNGDHPRFP